MKIYLAHSTGHDYKSELYAPLKEAFSREHELFLPHDSHPEGVNSKEALRLSDVVIAEVSLPSTGQGIELGWADTYNIPIICFYRHNSKVSGALRFISGTFIEYTNSSDMITQLRSTLNL